jgi:hypothetical protein
MNWKLRIKRWWKKTVEKIKETAKKIFKWANENRETAAAVVAIAISTVKSVSRMYVAHCDKIRRDRVFYDPRTGKYCETSRTLTRRERVRAEERHNRGETYQMIFYDMNVLR